MARGKRTIDISLDEPEVKPAAAKRQRAVKPAAAVAAAIDEPEPKRTRYERAQYEQRKESDRNRHNIYE
jgi:hypothetical protein